jgi:hypothetical protein
MATISVNEIEKRMAVCLASLMITPLVLSLLS